MSTAQADRPSTNRSRGGPAPCAIATARPRWRQRPEQTAETLYVIGGLYGNRPALAALRQLAAHGSPHRRRSVSTATSTGSMSMLPASLRSTGRCSPTMPASAMSRPSCCRRDDDAGCGCAYPESVDAGTVERSNRIHARLKQTAQRHPQLLRAWANLPMLRRYRVGDRSIGVVHGDAESLAGWGFDIAALSMHRPASRGWAECFVTPRSTSSPVHTPACPPCVRSRARRRDQQRRRRHAQFCRASPAA
jgi:hypothetical protein